MNDPIAAIVVTHQNEETIEVCLNRIRGADAVSEIRVVDNGSTDGTVSIVARHAAGDPRVRFIANPDNPGFGAACNEGAKICNAPWLAFVNPDCFVQADSLSRLRSHALNVGGLAVVGADLVDETGQRDPAARRHEPNFRHMLRTVSTSQLDALPDDTQPLQQVDAISGALMLMPRTLFDRIGGFDPGYRLHAEDLDLCRRARDARAVVAVANDVNVVHLRGVSSRSRPWFVEWHKHRGLQRYFDRYEAPRRSLFIRIGVRTMIWMRFPFAVLRAHVRR